MVTQSILSGIKKYLIHNKLPQMNLIKDVWLSKQLKLNAFNLKNVNLLNINFLKKKNLFITAKIKQTKKNSNNKILNKYFKFVDFNIQFYKKFSFDKKNNLKKNNISYRFAKKNDKKKITNISNNALEFSRFNLDSRISKKTSKKIQSEWISSFFKGKRGDHLIVAEYKKDICGFLLIISYKNTMTIDLIATANNFQRKGVASGMISFALKNKFKNKAKIIVGTQKSNLKSVNFYKKLGFKKKIIYAIFHYLKKN